MTAIVRGDANRIPLRSSSVDLIVTSPPYFGLRDYDDERQIGSEPTPGEFLEALWRVMHECWRVLKPTGSCFVNLGDKRAGSGGPGTTSGLGNGHVQGERSGKTTYGHDRSSEFGQPKSKMLLPHRFAIGCEDGAGDPEGIGWIVRQDLVWDKPNGMPESVKDRTRDAHEYFFHLTKTGRYFANIDEIRTPHLPGSSERAAAGFGGDRRAAVGAMAGNLRVEEAWGNGYEINPRGVIPSSVWRISTVPLGVPAHLELDEHFAAFPPEWPRRLILGFSRPGDTVLDPFGGTGTTAMVARALGRTGISLDLSYSRLATWRVFESDGAARVADRTAGERQGTLL